MSLIVQPQSEITASPEKKIPGLGSLKSYKHELFARALVLNLPLLECARRAGYDVMTKANAHKIARRRDVLDRVAYLAGNTDEILREKRSAIERELGAVAYANMDDFVKIDDKGLPVLDLSEVGQLESSERRSLMAAVKTVRYTDNGPMLELHGKLEAIAQLRKLNGTDAPDKHDLTLRRGADALTDHELAHIAAGSSEDAAAAPLGS